MRRRMTFGSPWQRLSLTWIVAVFGLLVGTAVEAAQEAPAEPAIEEATTERRVALVRLRLPLTGSADAVYQARLQRAVDQLTAEPAAEAARRPLLVIEFTPDTDGGVTEFERALRLARFLVSDEMARVKTLAYLPDSIEGHAVLVALACEEIAMAPASQLGRAAATEDTTRPIEPGIRASYQQIAEARRTAPPAVVLAMIDKATELVRVESDRGVEYALGSELEELRRDRAIVTEDIVAPGGTLAVFTGREAREEGIAKYLVSDRDALARALSVPAAALLEDQSLAGEWRPVMVDLSGPVTNRTARQLETLIGDELERNRVNWIGIRIDSSGGDLAAALRLAQSLAELGDGEVRTVAYVPKRAEGPAALVALACDQLVMQQESLLAGESDEEDRPLPPKPLEEDEPAKAEPADEKADEKDAAEEPEEIEEEDDEDPGRRLGGLRDLFDEDEDATRQAALATLREDLAPATSRTWSLLAAALDPSIELAAYSNRETGAKRFFSPEELEEQPVDGDWRLVERIKAAGEPLSLTAARAAELGVAWQQVEQFDDLQALYGLSDPPRTAEPNWALELVEALASPGLAALLLVVGIVGLYIELNTPGLGVGGFIATVALLLFFWSKFLDGTADWLEVLLFVTGLVFLLIELFVLPGFGIFGLGGALLVIASLVLASQTFILPQTETQLFELRNSIATVAGAGVGCLGLGILLRQYLPHSPLFRRATLAPLEEADRIEQDRREQLADYEHLVGMTGTAITDLLPGGRAEIDGEVVDVICQGEVVDRGDTVTVVKAAANRVVVRRVRS